MVQEVGVVEALDGVGRRTRKPSSAPRYQVGNCITVERMGMQGHLEINERSERNEATTWSPVMVR